MAKRNNWKISEDFRKFPEGRKPDGKGMQSAGGARAIARKPCISTRIGARKIWKNPYRGTFPFFPISGRLVCIGASR